MEAHMLDGFAVKAADRLSNGLPADFRPETQYGYEARDERIVCVPVRPRTRKPVEFSGLGF